MTDEFQTIPGRRTLKEVGIFQPGEMLCNRYEVLAQLGKGGMGIVYKCLDKTSGKSIALKTISPELAQNPYEMDLTKDNFNLVSELHHPYIANYNALEFDPERRVYYLIMEFVDGEDIRYYLRRMKQEGADFEKLLLKLLRQAADALDYAHGKKIVHKDIKPANMMVDRDGNLKLLDFGLAAKIHMTMTMTLGKAQMEEADTSGGTLMYISPEQLAGKWDKPTMDQYSLAATAYELFSGHAPFNAPDLDVLKDSIRQEVPERLEEVSPAIADAIAKALNKEPADRFSSCTAFVEAMEGKNPKQEEKPPSSVTGKTSAAKYWMIASLLLFISVCIIGYFMQNRSDKSTNRTEEITETQKTENSSSSNVSDKSDGSDKSEKSDRTGSSSATGEPDVTVAEPKPPANLTETLPEPRTFTLPNGVKLEMVKVEPGSFTMSKRDGENFGDEVAHRKTLTKAFYIGKYEVTQEQWYALMKSTIRDQRDKANTSWPLRGEGNKYPVYYVSWKEAMSFCEKMNQYLPSDMRDKWKFTLPTETQWEFAARGGNRSKGYKYSGSNNLDEFGWYSSNSESTTHEVGRKYPNELGLYDMSGNVWEWCLDNWQSKSDATCAEFDRPYHDEDGSYRVYRGGSWPNLAKLCRSAYRNNCLPGVRYFNLGFRLALVPVD